MSKLDFLPARDGFHFANRFANNLGTIPGIGPITTAGRCGGMSFAALDFYFAHIPVPAYAESDFTASNGVPPDKTPLSDYIYQRQVDSFLTFSATKLVIWSLSPDAPTFFLRGVSSWTKVDEFNKLRLAIDAGRPVPLGLIIATNLAGIANNHQVVAYGYDTDSSADLITIYIYDNNHPDQEVTLSSDRNEMHFLESTGENWRGFFVQNYSLHRPPASLATLPAQAIR